MHLHVICFDQPYPPAYGGAVEMYYKLRELHAAGFKLILHIFLYNNAQQQQETERLAEKTYYYRRKTGIMPNLSLKPYIVESRRSPELLDNLCRDSHPILFEGLHTTFFLSHPRLAGRLKMVRTHNIEHTFYFYLAKNKPLSWRALFFIVEAAKLRIYERVLRHADRILAISQADTDELSARYPDHDVRLLQCFFDNKTDDSIATSQHPLDEKPYILYHGNLAVSENHRAAEYIVRNIAMQLPQYQFVIAGRQPASQLELVCHKADNVMLVSNPQHDYLQKLIHHAHINLMLTFQPTGIKLKLLTTLAKSAGYCIANNYMLHGNKLGSLCCCADTAEQIIAAVDKLMQQPTCPDAVEQRQEQLRQLGFGDISSIADRIG